jgi:hypothetical protein
MIASSPKPKRHLRNTFRFGLGLAVLLAAFFFSAATPLSAGVFSRIAKKSAKVADDIPLRNADELAETFAHNKAAREALENATKRTLKSTNPLALRNALKSELHALDPSLVRFADTLPTHSQQYMLVLNRGAKNCERAMPDMLARANFLKRGGAETVTAVGMYGTDIAKSAMRFDAALHGGKIISPKGMRAVQLDDFGKLFTQHGDAAYAFWTKNVVPHWKLWLGGTVGGGAVAWYLLDPQGFMDTAGNLTEEGFRRLTQFTGDVAAAIIRGAVEGAKTAVEKVAVATRESFFTSWSGVTVFILLVVGVVLALPFTRYFALRPFRFLLRKPKRSNNEPSS